MTGRSSLAFSKILALENKRTLKRFMRRLLSSSCTRFLHFTFEFTVPKDSQDTSSQTRQDKVTPVLGSRGERFYH